MKKSSNKQLKREARARQARTGEHYTTALAHVRGTPTTMASPVDVPQAFRDRADAPLEDETFLGPAFFRLALHLLRSDPWVRAVVGATGAASWRPHHFLMTAGGALTETEGIFSAEIHFEGDGVEDLSVQGEGANAIVVVSGEAVRGRSGWSVARYIVEVVVSDAIDSATHSRLKDEHLWRQFRAVVGEHQREPVEVVAARSGRDPASVYKLFVQAPSCWTWWMFGEGPVTMVGSGLVSSGYGADRGDDVIRGHFEALRGISADPRYEGLPEALAAIHAAIGG